MASKRVSQEDAAATLTGTEIVRIVQSGNSVRTTLSEVVALATGSPVHGIPIGGTTGQVLSKVDGTDYNAAWATPSGGGSSITLAHQAWVEVGGNDGTGAVGDPSLPFATINGALDALVGVTATVRINIGLGTFAPVHDDAATPTTLDGSTKLRSNVEYIGSGRPHLNSETAPTQLVGGTIVQGPWVTHSTRHNVTVRNLGIDSGVAVCGALGYAGNGEECLLFCNIGQVDVGTVGSSRNIQVHNVFCLGLEATGPFHALLMENVIDSAASQIRTQFNTHGTVFKAVNTQAWDIHGKGHSLEVLDIKESNVGNNTAPCHHVSVYGVTGGSTPGTSDTPYGLRIHAADVRDITNIVVTGIAFTGLATQDVIFQKNSTGVAKRIELQGTTDFTSATYGAGSPLLLGDVLSAADPTLVSVNGWPVRPLWMNMTLLSGWSNFSGYTMKFSQARDGKVTVTGLVAGGSGNIAVLPAGSRPPQTLRFPTVSHNGANFVLADLTVDTSGNIAMESGSSGLFFGTDISFYPF